MHNYCGLRDWICMTGEVLPKVYGQNQNDLNYRVTWLVLWQADKKVLPKRQHRRILITPTAGAKPLAIHLRTLQPMFYCMGNTTEAKLINLFALLAGCLLPLTIYFLLGNRLTFAQEGKYFLRMLCPLYL